MLRNSWFEVEYRLGISHTTNGSHVEVEINPWRYRPTEVADGSTGGLVFSKALIPKPQFQFS